MIRHIIWDAGGTLFDTYPAMTAAFLSALEEHGVHAIPERVRALARVSQRHCAETLAADYDLPFEPFWNRYRLLLNQAPPEEQPPFPGAPEVCAAIVRAGGLNLMASHRARGSIEQLLRAYGLAGLFSEVITTEDGYPRKPDPAMLLALLERHALDPRQVLAIGDREIDIQAGRAAGVCTCLFRGKSALRADVEIEEYAELGKRM